MRTQEKQREKQSFRRKSEHRAHSANAEHVRADLEEECVHARPSCCEGRAGITAWAPHVESVRDRQCRAVRKVCTCDL